MRRAIKICYTNGTFKELELSRGAKINSPEGMIHLEKMKDGTWRLLFSEDIAKEFSEIDRFEMIRED